jgi:hypothetical protein
MIRRYKLSFFISLLFGQKIFRIFYQIKSCIEEEFLCLRPSSIVIGLKVGG